MNKLLATGVGIILALMPAAATNANPTLPLGDELFEVSCSGAVNDRQLHALNLADGTRTALGSGFGTDVEGDCASQGAMYPGTNWF